MTSEAKVGAFALGGLILFCVAIIGLSDIKLGINNDYKIYAGFRQAIGLQPQSEVRLSGVLIGRVAKIENDGLGVTVTMGISPDKKIPKDSKVSISSTGVMGEKFINFQPRSDTGEYLRGGEYFYGFDETNMDQVFDSMAKVMDKVEDLLENVQDILGDKVLKNSVVEISDNLRDTSSHVENLTSSLERAIIGNETFFKDMIIQMSSAIQEMNGAMNNIEHMTSNLDKFVSDPNTVENLQTTVENISTTSRNLAKMTKNMDKFIGNPKVTEDLTKTVSNARSVSERADKILEKIQSAGDKISAPKATPSIEMLYSGKAHDWNANFNLNFKSNDKEIILGAEDIGNQTKLNLQAGKKLNKILGARTGILAGKFGIGLDVHLGSKWKFSTEVYDPNSEKIRLKSQYKIGDLTYVLGEWRFINREKERAIYFGLKQEF